MVRIIAGGENYVYEGIDTPSSDTDAANKKYVDDHPSLGAIAAYSATETYSQGEYIRYTDNIIYYWNSSTDSAAGTSPDSSGNSWVAIRSGNGISGTNYDLAYRGIKSLAFDMQSWTVVSDIQADDVDDNDVQITINGDTTVLIFHPRENWWGSNQEIMGSFLQVFDSSDNAGIYPIIGIDEIDENRLIVGKVIEGPDHLANANVGDTDLSFYISQGLRVRTAGIYDGAVTNDKLADNSVDSDQYVDASIDEPHLNISNTPTAGQVLSSDGSDGFTWVDDSGHGVSFDSADIGYFRGEFYTGPEGQNYTYRSSSIAISGDTDFTIGTDGDGYRVEFNPNAGNSFWDDQQPFGSYMRIYDGTNSGFYAILDADYANNIFRISNVLSGTDVIASISNNTSGFGFGLSEAFPTNNIGIVDGAIDADKLADNAVTNAKLADNAVNTAELMDDAVTQAKIADNAVGRDQLADNAVGFFELAPNAVHSTVIQANAVTNDKIADDAVQYENIDVAGTAGQVLKINSAGDNWEWATDTANTYTGGDGIAISDSNVVSVDHGDTLEFDSASLQVNEDIIAAREWVTNQINNATFPTNLDETRTDANEIYWTDVRQEVPRMTQDNSINGNRSRIANTAGAQLYQLVALEDSDVTVNNTSPSQTPNWELTSVNVYEGNNFSGTALYSSRVLRYTGRSPAKFNLTAQNNRNVYFTPNGHNSSSRYSITGRVELCVAKATDDFRERYTPTILARSNEFTFDVQDGSQNNVISGINIPGVSADDNVTIQPGDYVGWRWEIHVNHYDDSGVTEANAPYLTFSGNPGTQTISWGEYDATTLEYGLYVNDTGVHYNNVVANPDITEQVLNTDGILVANHQLISHDDSHAYGVALGFEAATTQANELVIGSTVAGEGIQHITTPHFRPASGTEFLTIDSSGDWGLAVSPANPYVQTRFTGDAPAQPGTSSILIGADSTDNTAAASGSSSIVIGDGARSSGNNSVSIGADATTGANNNSFALGHNAITTTGAASAIAFGANSSAGSTDGTIANGPLAFGSGADATDDNAMALGSNTQASGTNSIAIGGDINTAANAANAAGANSIAIGHESSAAVDDTMAIGRNAEARTGSNQSIVIGRDANASSVESVVVGYNASTTSNGGRSVVMGHDAASDSVQGVVLGHDADLNVNSNNGIAIGNAAQAGSTVAGTATERTIAIGAGTQSRANSTIALGANSAALADNSIAIGGADGLANAAQTDGARSISIGFNTDVSSNSDDSIALGTHVSVTHDKAIVIGHGADSSNKLDSVADNTIVLGYTDQITQLGRQTASTDDDLAVATKKYVDDNGAGANSIGLDQINAGTSVAGHVLQVNSTNDGLVWADEQQIQISELADIGDVADPGNNLGGRPLVKMAGTDTGWAAQALTADGIGTNAIEPDKFNVGSDGTDGTTGQVPRVSTTSGEWTWSDYNFNALDGSLGIGQIADGLITNAKLASSAVDYNVINATGSAGQILAIGTDGTSLDWVEQVTVPSSTFYLSVNSTGSVAAATGTNGIAIGSGATASDDDAIAIGDGAQSTNNQTIAIGEGAQATTQGAIAIGDGAQSNNGSGYQIAIGRQANADDNNAIAIGNGADATGAGSVALGVNTLATTTNSIAIGSNVQNGVSNSILLGASDHTVRLGRPTQPTDGDNQIVTKGYADNLIGVNRSTINLSWNNTYIQALGSGEQSSSVPGNAISQIQWERIGNVIFGSFTLQLAPTAVSGDWQVGDRSLLGGIASMGLGTYDYFGCGTAVMKDTWASNRMLTAQLFVRNAGNFGFIVTDVGIGGVGVEETMYGSFTIPVM